MYCRWHSECVTNNNGDTGFVTALIFSVVTEQTIGALTVTLLSIFPCCVIYIRLLYVLSALSKWRLHFLQAMETRTQISAGLLLG